MPPESAAEKLCRILTSVVGRLLKNRKYEIFWKKSTVANVPSDYFDVLKSAGYTFHMATSLGEVKENCR